MTAATAATDVPAGPAPRRESPVVRVARLQLVAWRYGLWPWTILLLSFLVNFMIFGSVDEAREGWTGGLGSIYLVQIGASAQVFTRGFPFALAMSVTRRSYYLGAWLYAVLLSAASGVVLVVLRVVEDATGGWGVGLTYFGVGPVHQDDLAVQYLVYTVPFLLVAAVGTAIGVVVVRWGSNGAYSMIAGLIVVAGVAIVAVARAGWWGAIGDWFERQPPAALFAGWPLPFVVVLGLLGYAAIRRATP